MYRSFATTSVRAFLCQIELQTRRARAPKNENFTIDLSFPTIKFAKKPDVDPPFLLAMTAPDVAADLRLRNDL